MRFLHTGLRRPQALQASGIDGSANKDGIETFPFQRTQVRLGCTHRLESVRLDTLQERDVKWHNRATEVRMPWRLSNMALEGFPREA